MSDSLLDHEAERHYDDGWNAGYADAARGLAPNEPGTNERGGAFASAYWAGYAAAYGEEGDDE